MIIDRDNAFKAQSSEESWGMETKATPRQSIERTTVAPVERQKAARLAGCRAGDPVTLDDDQSAKISRDGVEFRGVVGAGTACSPVHQRPPTQSGRGTAWSILADCLSAFLTPRLIRCAWVPARFIAS
jgi:hypothetical protein